MHRSIHCICCFLFMIGGICQASTYANLFADSFGKSFTVTDQDVILGDLAYAREKCLAKRSSPCIRTERFVFYVPSDFPSIRIWYGDDAAYHLKSRHRGVWQNTDIDIFVIEQSWRGGTVNFAYSTEFGVLAITPGSGGQLTLLDPCGFAAMPSSRHCAGLRAP